MKKVLIVLLKFFIIVYMIICECVGDETGDTKKYKNCENFLKCFFFN